MAKSKMRFINEPRVKSRRSKKRHRRDILLAVISALMIANFAWDGYNREADFTKASKLGSEYYGIISSEASRALNNIKNQIDKE